MSPKNSILKTSLSALGVIGFAVCGLADPPVPPPAEQAPNAAPATQQPADAVLLLSDGRVLQGKVSLDSKGYMLKQKGNALPVKRETVQGVFPTLQEAYEFLAERAPANDPDEQLKLARWCLTNQLKEHAKFHLEQVVALSPKYSPAKQMLEAISFFEERAALRDPDVSRTAAVVPADAPGELKLEARELQGRPKLERYASGGPLRIFDLPPALATKRAEEFANYVQPVLQSRCAGCHNEKYTGEFQLIQFKNKRDHSAAAYRFNLDATLRLIDLENPSKSELLSSGLRPHGKGSNKRPIFLGSNDQQYQVLLTWVERLKGKGARVGAPAAAVRTAGAAGEEEEFAADRGNRNFVVADETPMMKRPGQPSVLSGGPQQIPPRRFVPGQGLVPDANPADSDEFPVPFAAGGAGPKMKVPPSSPATATAPPSELPSLPESTAIPPPSADKPSVDTAKTPRKPVKLDDSMLQRVLQNRNSQR